MKRHQINVSVQPAYIPEQSEPEKAKFVFAYTVTMSNAGSAAASLLTRHWIITNGDGDTEEVRGEGVVGEFPHLQPGQSFQYTSGSVLRTPVGTMSGSYQMRAEDGTEFDAQIPIFTLNAIALH